MIIGVGTDVVDVARLGRSLARAPALAARLFTPAERGLPLSSLAARVAAKEAVAKALGAPPGLSWQDAEVRRGEHGRPHLTVAGGAGALADRLGVRRWHLALSHDGGVAIAFVVAEG